jgi:hypothetical protein
VRFREVARLISGGAAILVIWSGQFSWVDDTAEWWRENADQVETKDHPAAGPWPEQEAYRASVWFSSASKVIVLDVEC